MQSFAGARGRESTRHDEVTRDPGARRFAMNIGEIVREVEVLPDQEPQRIPDPEPVREEPVEAPERV